MFYQLEDDAISINADEINDKILTAGFINISELEKQYKAFGFYAKSVEKCKISSSTISDIDMLEGYCFFILNTVYNEKLAVFIKKNLLLLVNLSESSKYNKDYFINLISYCKNDNLTLERLICNFLELITSDSLKTVDEKRVEIGLLEEKILKSNTDINFNQKLLNIRCELLSLVSLYERLINISETLADNENQLFDEVQTRIFELFTRKTERTKSNIDLLSDSVVHLWDSFQAHLDTRLNETMKIFTMITTVFFPLTVIVGWYGMNFRFMPELSAVWGYPFVILLSIAIVISLVIWFKLKKWI